MKARTFILTAGATLALAVPAAQAASARNGLYQVQVHTVLAESQAAKSSATSAELQAIRLRGAGLNSEYHIGFSASVAGATSAELRAIRLRGAGLNSKYHTGS
jgi:hypothetical protein